MISNSGEAVGYAAESSSTQSKIGKEHCSIVSGRIKQKLVKEVDQSERGW